MPAKSREQAAQQDAARLRAAQRAGGVPDTVFKNQTDEKVAAEFKARSAGPHHVRLTADHGKGAVSYLPQTYRDRAGAERAAKPKRGAGFMAEILPGRLPTDALPGGRPGEDAQGNKVTPHTEAVRRAARSAGTTALHPCRCGCGTDVHRLYAQGHDARHVSRLTREYREAHDGDVPRAKLIKLSERLMGELDGRPLLQAKLNNAMANVDSGGSRH